MRETPFITFIKNGTPPIRHLKQAVFQHDTIGSLHPAIGNQNPESRQTGGQCHVEGRKQMHAFTNFVPTKNHEANKTSFIHKGGNGFKAQNIPKEGTNGLRERPIENAEGHLHGDTGSHTGSEIDNGWMQTPDGVVLKHGLFLVTNWWSAIFNESNEWGFPHMWVATMILGFFVLASTSAWFILKNRYADLFVKMLKPAILALLIAMPIQIWLGDSLGVDVAHSEPTSLAAMEGHYHAYLPDGKPNTSWNLIAIPNAANDGSLFSISIPHVGIHRGPHSKPQEYHNPFTPEQREKIPLHGMIHHGFEVMG